MFGPGTSIYSILFYAIALIVTILTVWFLVRLWAPIVKSIDEAEKGKPIPLIINPLIKTIVAITIFVVALTLGWNAKQSLTTTTSSYKNPAETEEQKKVQEATLPTPEEFDKTRTEQKQREQVKPQEDAFDSFNKSMKEEEMKIKKRSLESNTETAH